MESKHLKLFLLIVVTVVVLGLIVVLVPSAYYLNQVKNKLEEPGPVLVYNQHLSDLTDWKYTSVKFFSLSFVEKMVPDKATHVSFFCITKNGAFFSSDDVQRESLRTLLENCDNFQSWGIFYINDFAPLGFESG